MIYFKPVIVHSLEINNVAFLGTTEITSQVIMDVAQYLSTQDGGHEFCTVFKFEAFPPSVR